MCSRLFLVQYIGWEPKYFSVNTKLTQIITHYLKTWLHTWKKKSGHTLHRSYFSLPGQENSNRLWKPLMRYFYGWQTIRAIFYQWCDIIFNHLINWPSEISLVAKLNESILPINPVHFSYHFTHRETIYFVWFDTWKLALKII